jgi:hypothetical protein
MKFQLGFLRSIIAQRDSSLIDGIVLMCPALIRSSSNLGVSAMMTKFGVCFHNFFIHRENGVLWLFAEKHQRNTVLDDCSGVYMCSEELSMRVELLCAILDPGVRRVCIEYESRVASQAACSTHHVQSWRSVTRISACLALLFTFSISLTSVAQLKTTAAAVTQKIGTYYRMTSCSFLTLDSAWEESCNSRL